MYGFRASEAIGRSILMLIPPERHAEEGDILARLRRGERVEPLVDLHAQGINGEFPKGLGHRGYRASGSRDGPSRNSSHSGSLSKIQR
jgi:hypothetical protein